MGYFLQDWIVNPMLNHLKRTMTFPRFKPGNFGVAVSILNHYTIEVRTLFARLDVSNPRFG
jgi:hypothetical protein